MRTIVVQLFGHLSTASLAKALAPAAQTDPFVLVVDASEMTGYDVTARDAFIQWNRDHRPLVRRVGVVTQRLLWRSVIAAMAFASGQDMRAFSTRGDALAWVDEACG